MAKIERKTQKIFCGSANQDQLAVFGSMKTGTPDYSADIEELQSATYERGWADAILDDKAPYLEEMNGVQYGLSSQIAYILQQGMSEYDDGTTYYKGSLASVINNTDVVIYNSVKDDNTNSTPSANSEDWSIYYTPKLIDGQWQPLDVRAINNQTYPTTQDVDISLSTVLPDDGYNYELLISGTGTTSNQSDVTRIFVKSSIITSPVGICEVKSPSNVSMYGYGAVSIPIGTDRKLFISRYTGSSTVGTYSIYLRGYRRLGINS